MLFYLSQINGFLWNLSQFGRNFSLATWANSLPEVNLHTAEKFVLPARIVSGAGLLTGYESATQQLAVPRKIPGASLV